jgi:hypothetical protein
MGLSKQSPDGLKASYLQPAGLRPLSPALQVGAAALPILLSLLHITLQFQIISGHVKALSIRIMLP